MEREMGRGGATKTPKYSVEYFLAYFSCGDKYCKKGICFLLFMQNPILHESIVYQLSSQFSPDFAKIWLTFRSNFAKPVAQVSLIFR